MRYLSYTIEPCHDKMQVQDYLMKAHGYSHRIITRLKKVRGDILLCGEHIRMVDTVSTGDIINIRLYEDSYIIPNEKLAVPIVYEDEDVLIYDKPQNMPVHPSRNHQTDTLANAFCHHMKEHNIKATFRPINRLDRDTCGLCAVAKNSLAASKLQRSLKKEYTAIVCGELDSPTGTINAPIVRLDDFHIMRAVRDDGQPAVTHYRVEAVSKNAKYTKVSVSLETGRTHQIRVHFSHIGHPLAGDDMYGGNTSDLKSQALCCTSVSFMHPLTDENINIGISMPENLQLIMVQ